MTLDPVRQTSLSDQVVERLRTEIVEGRWRVGERIPPEPELMVSLGVARGTLREALRALQYSGMLDIRRGDGTFVSARSEVPGALARSGGAPMTTPIHSPLFAGFGPQTVPISRLVIVG